MTPLDDSPDRVVLDDVAARYGVVVPPGLTVNRVPRGVSGIPLPVWNGVMLAMPDFKSLRGDAGAIEKRRAAVGRLHAEGLTVKQMMARFGVSIHTVVSDHRRLGLTPNPERQVLALAAPVQVVTCDLVWPDGAAARAAVLLPLLGTCDLPVLAQRLGLNLHSLKKCIQRLREGGLLPRTSKQRTRGRA